jgi:hypothetical protein
MEAVSAAIPPLGSGLDLIVQRILTHMRKRSTTRGDDASEWPAGDGGWMGAPARGSEMVTRSQESDSSRCESDERKKKEEGGRPRLTPPYL